MLEAATPQQAEKSAALPSQTIREWSLTGLFAPSSIAIVGASDRPGTIGEILTSSLQRMEFAGPIWPVNPRHSELYGLRCFASINDLPAAPDLVVFGVKGSAAVEELGALAARGVRAAIIYDSGFTESGKDGADLQSRLVTLCREYRIALCGPNCMGIISPHSKTSTYRLAIVDPDRLKGNVGLISHSGSITIGLLSDVRRFGFSSVISAGNEAVIDAVDYINYLIDDPHTKIIAAFLESVRRPDEFRRALERAATFGKPVVILKVGRSERAERAIVSHTGGLAGETHVFSEVLRRANAIEVTDLVEMTEVLAALQAARRPRGRRIAVVTGSGGQAELLLDIAESANLSLPPLGPSSIAEVERVIGRVTGDGNPLDAWGNGDVRTNLTHALDVLVRDDGYDAIAYCAEHADGAPIKLSEVVIPILVEASRKSDKPFYGLNLRPGLIWKKGLDLLQAEGLAMLGGARQGLAAIDRVARYELKRKTKSSPATGHLNRGAHNPILGETRSVINEFDGKRLLAGFGVPIPVEELVQSPEAACIAAERIGWPVVLKAISDDVPHKTELGLVKLNIRDADELRAAWSDLVARFAKASAGATLAGLLVQPMIAEGFEVFAGLRRIPDWGLVLVFGLGGVFLEVMRDVAMRTLPLEPGDVREMIAET
ncbi:MAG: acetate--CoA ligase family protein, partial [Pirellulales bacterium]|nr:acetate--CoA ligase family protein [Pirellulales bacterium]